METSAIQSIKLAIVAATGLSKDALHIYVGLAVFLAAAIVLRKPLRSNVPWFVVVSVVITGEVLDMRDDISSLGYWRWGASLHDILNTLFWPSIFLLLAKFDIFFHASSERNA
jgi:cell shape-determining protein MreD